MATYTIKLPFDRLKIDYDGVHSESPIWYEGADGEWFPTPFQTADASHDVDTAAVMVIEWLGSDYWHDPDDDYPDDEEDYIRDLIEDIAGDGGSYG